MNDRQIFWQLAYLVQLYKSTYPTPEGRTIEAQVAANLAVSELDTFLDGEEINDK